MELGQSSDTERSVQHRDAEALINLGIPNVADPAKPWGSPKVSDSIKTVANMGFDINDGTELYAFGNFASREVETPFFYRSPMNRTGVYKTGDDIFLTAGDGCQEKHGVPSTADNLLAYRDAVLADPGCFSFVELYPEGFTPIFGAKMTDYSLFAGIKSGLSNGLLYDVSASIGGKQHGRLPQQHAEPVLGRRLAA